MSWQCIEFESDVLGAFACLILSKTYLGPSVTGQIDPVPEKPRHSLGWFRVVGYTYPLTSGAYTGLNQRPCLVLFIYLLHTQSTIK